MTKIAVDFLLTRTEYDHGFGSMVRHTIETPGLVISGKPQVEGMMSLVGMDLKPGQRVSAVFTIEDDPQT